MRKTCSIVISIILLTICLIFTACNSNADPLEDKTGQVILSSVTGPDMNTYPGSKLNLYVQCDNIKNLPDNPVYVWTVFLEGSIINDIIHDKDVSSDQDEEEDEVEEDEEWPCTDEIRYEFLGAGTYKFRVDLYDNDEYKTLKELATRRGTYTYTVYCEPVKVTITAKPTGESREYNVKATIENKNVLGFFNYPKWRFINWDTVDPDGGKTENTSDPDDIFNKGIAEVTHQFQRDGNFKIIFSLKDDKENEIAKTEIMLNIKGVDLAIIAPEQPLKTGQEYTFTVRNDYPETMPEDPVYKWDFGDNNGITIPFSNEATHLYEKEGTYTVKVELFESEAEGAPLLGMAAVDIVVGRESLSIIEAYQNVKHVDVLVHTWVLWRYEEGKKPSSSTSDQTFGDVSANYKAITKSSEITWRGTEFEIKSSGGEFTCNGQISDDGSELLYLDVTYVWDNVVKKSGSYTLKNVPLKKSTGIDGSPDAIEFTNNWGYYSFEFIATGLEVEPYVFSQAHHEEYNYNGVIAKNFDGWDPERAAGNSFELKFYVTQGD